MSQLPKVTLTKRQLEVLRILRDAVDIDARGYPENQIIYERDVGYVGLKRINGRTLFALLRACALRDISDGGACERYEINETGRKLLAEAEGAEG